MEAVVKIYIDWAKSNKGFVLMGISKDSNPLNFTVQSNESG